MNKLLNKILFFKKETKNQNISFEYLKKNTSIGLLFSAFDKYSEKSEIRFVGGCIRKILKKETIDDIDFAVNLKPDECISVLKAFNIKYYETGIKHGTITAIIENTKFEITSLRKDVNTDGRHAKVIFTNSWLEDASRRDFTINSIYSDIDGNLYDPFNGKKDLEIGKIQFIGDAEKRIKEDYLRILRYIRFFISYSKLPHSKKIKKIIKQNLIGISKISSERLLDEFRKIVKSKNFLRLFEDPFSEEIIQLIFPQFKNLEFFKNLNNFAIKKITGIDYIFLISLMVVDNSDNVNYFLFRYNLSNADKKRILFLKEFYDKKIDVNTFSKQNLWKIFYYNGKKSLEDLLLFEIFRSKHVNKKLVNLLEFFKDKEIPIFPIKAKKIMEKYNISEGKKLGEKLKKIEEKWIDNSFNLSEKEISEVLRN